MDNSPKQWFVANWLFHRWLAVIENHYHIIESNWTRLPLRPKPLLTIDHSIGWCVEGLNLFQSMTDVGSNKAIGHSINNWKNYWPFYRWKILPSPNSNRQNQQFWIWQGFQTRVLVRCSCDWHRSAGRLVPPPLPFLWCNFCPSRTLCLTSINAFTVV